MVVEASPDALLASSFSFRDLAGLVEGVDVVDRSVTIVIFTGAFFFFGFYGLKALLNVLGITGINTLGTRAYGVGDSTGTARYALGTATKLFVAQLIRLACSARLTALVYSALAGFALFREAGFGLTFSVLTDLAG